jgi:Aldo/keto reductase family
MKYVKLGTTGLDVSALALGCMSHGTPERGTHPWTLPEEESRPFIQRAVELGINFFDTADMHSDGTSEEIVGRALKDFAVTRRGRRRQRLSHSPGLGGRPVAPLSARGSGVHPSRASHLSGRGRRRRILPPSHHGCVIMDGPRPST